MVLSTWKEPQNLSEFLTIKRKGKVMNELEMLMIAESKKNAIDDEFIKDEQQCEYDKACNWATETMDKLSFLEN